MWSCLRCAGVGEVGGWRFHKWGGLGVSEFQVRVHVGVRCTVQRVVN